MPQHQAGHLTAKKISESSDPPQQIDNPFFSDDFARVYDETASRITGSISSAALERVVSVGPGTHVLDIAAGAGALAVPAAERGANVLAVDIAPGMVARLAGKLSRFPGCEARQMDGQALGAVCN